jgi:hypothetical protein
MKNTPIHVCVKTAFVGRHSADSRRIGSFHKFLSFNPYFRKYFKLVYRANVVVLTSTTDVMFLLFSSEFYEGVPRVRRPPAKWSATAWSLRNNALNALSHNKLSVTFLVTLKHHEPWILRRWQPSSTRLHDATSQRAVIFKLAALRTWSLKPRISLGDQTCEHGVHIQRFGDFLWLHFQSRWTPCSQGWSSEKTSSHSFSIRVPNDS